MLHFDYQPFYSLFNKDENVASLAQFQRFRSDHRFLGRYWVARVPGLRLRHIGLLPVSQLCDVLSFAVFLLSVMPSFEGVLLFSDFNITTIATISPLDLCNRHTKLRILRIEGELSGDVGRVRILLHLQHASHWFHDERWDIFTLVGGDADSFGDAEFGRGRRPQGGFTRIRLTAENELDICNEMENFELDLFDRFGQWQSRTRPFADWWIVSVHPCAAMYFCDRRVQNIVLAAVLQYCPLKHNEPRYWVRYDPSALDPYDKGLVLRERGRWRSQESLEWLMDNGFSGVPDEIVQELKDLCLHLQPKRDNGDMVSRPTKVTRVSDDTAMTPLGSAAVSNSVDTFNVHPPPVRRSGPREPPAVRARNLGERLFAGISVLNQSHPIGLDPLSSSSNSGNPLRDQAPCLLSNTIQDDQSPAAEEDGEPLLSCPGAVPADVGAAALRTTEARRVLDDSFSSLCAAIEAYNEAVRCEAHLRGVYGLSFSP